MERSETVKELFAPFAVDYVKFRTGNEIKKPCGAGLSYFNVYLYIDKETIQDRLDDVLGPMGWQAIYTELKPVDTWLCNLSLVIDGQECVKQGASAPTDQMKKQADKTKSAMTGAFRAAAGEWGFDRNLDRLPQIIWAGVIKNDKFSYWQDEKGLRKTIESLITREAAGNLSPAEAKRTVWWKPEGQRALSPEPEEMPVDEPTPAPEGRRQPPQAQGQAPAKQTPPPPPPAPVESIFVRKAKAFVAAGQVKVIEPGQKWAVGVEAVGQQINHVALTQVDGKPSSFCPCMDFFEGRHENKEFQCAHTLAVRFYQAQISKQKAS